MREELINALKILLADTYAVYFKAHGYHWNVEGKNFPQYHEFYSMIAEDIYGSADDIAENIRKLQAYAPFKMSRFMEITTIPETEVGSSCEEMNADLYMAMERLIVTINVAFQAAIAANEQGIADFLAGRDDITKKFCWQLRVSMM